jgi:hypothetical protein
MKMKVMISLVMEHRWNEIDRGKPQYSGEKPVPVTLSSPQIPHGMTKYRTRASTVRRRRLTARGMARPSVGGLLAMYNIRRRSLAGPVLLTSEQVVAWPSSFDLRKCFESFLTSPSRSVYCSPDPFCGGKGGAFWCRLRCSISVVSKSPPR